MPEQAAAPGMMDFLIPLGGMFLIFYVLVFRPQSRAQKTREEMLKAIKKHDMVVTRGGLIGSVANLKGNVVTLKLSDNVRVDVERAAIDRLWQEKEVNAEQSN